MISRMSRGWGFGPPKNCGGAVHHAGEGHAPRIGVEHGDDVQDHVPFRQGEHVHRRRREAVEKDAAMGVDHALRMPRGARRVTHARGVGLIDPRPLGHRPGLRHQRLVVQRAGRDLGVGSVPHHDDVPDAPEISPDRLEDGPEARIDDQDLVLGVVDDVGDVLGRQPEIDGVEHGAHQRRREVHLQVAVRVPRQCAHPVARPDPKGGQRSRQTRRAVAEVGVGVLHETRAGHPGAERLLREELPCPLEEVGQGERMIHDQALHRVNILPGRSSPSK